MIETPLQAAEQIIAEYVICRRYPVPCGYLLAFFVGASIVTDRRFVDGALQLGHLGGNLDLKSKPVRMNLHLPDNIAPESLVTRFHVGKVDVGRQVR